MAGLWGTMPLLAITITTLKDAHSMRIFKNATKRKSFSLFSAGLTFASEARTIRFSLLVWILAKTSIVLHIPSISSSMEPGWRRNKENGPFKQLNNSQERLFFSLITPCSQLSRKFWALGLTLGMSLRMWTQHWHPNCSKSFQRSPVGSGVTSIALAYLRAIALESTEQFFWEIQQFQWTNTSTTKLDIPPGESLRWTSSPNSSHMEKAISMRSQVLFFLISNRKNL